MQWWLLSRIRILIGLWCVRWLFVSVHVEAFPIVWDSSLVWAGWVSWALCDDGWAGEMGEMGKLGCAGCTDGCAGASGWDDGRVSWQVVALFLVCGVDALSSVTCFLCRWGLKYGFRMCGCGLLEIAAIYCGICWLRGAYWGWFEVDVVCSWSFLRYNCFSKYDILFSSTNIRSLIVSSLYDNVSNLDSTSCSKDSILIRVRIVHSSEFKLMTN